MADDYVGNFLNQLPSLLMRMRENQQQEVRYRQELAHRTEQERLAEKRYNESQEMRILTNIYSDQNMRYDQKLKFLDPERWGTEGGRKQAEQYIASIGDIKAGDEFFISKLGELFPNMKQPEIETLKSFSEKGDLDRGWEIVYNRLNKRGAIKTDIDKWELKELIKRQWDMENSLIEIPEEEKAGVKERIGALKKELIGGGEPSGKPKLFEEPEEEKPEVAQAPRRSGFEGDPRLALEQKIKSSLLSLFEGGEREGVKIEGLSGQDKQIQSSVNRLNVQIERMLNRGSEKQAQKLIERMKVYLEKTSNPELKQTISEYINKYAK